jgi:hypothetical protein
MVRELAQGRVPAAVVATTMLLECCAEIWRLLGKQGSCGPFQLRRDQAAHARAPRQKAPVASVTHVPVHRHTAPPQPYHSSMIATSENAATPPSVRRLPQRCPPPGHATHGHSGDLGKPPSLNDFRCVACASAAQAALWPQVAAALGEPLRERRRADRGAAHIWR